MKNRKASFKYDANVLKNGYEAMAKINLTYAEAALSGDSKDLRSYEEILKVNNFMGEEIDD